jgi:spoIIIJ-associated protein
MTSYKEFAGKDIEQAVQKACKKLKMDKENIKYKVISHGSSGIFGLAGRKKAKISVSIPAAAPDLVNEPANKTENKKDRSEKKLAAEKAPSRGIENSPESQTHSTRQTLGSENDTVQIGKEVLQRIIDSITVDAEIKVEEKSSKTIFNVVGGNSALLIGKRGKTLEAIQLIVEKVINKRNEKRIRTIVDIEGYKEKRISYLKSLAKRLADKCKRFGKPMSLGEMNAHDRRIIHITLKGDKEVSTRSKGEGVLRKIVIFPKKSSHHKKEMSQA